MMKLFYATNTCSTGIRVLLEEIGKPYEATRIDFASRQQFSPEFRAVNPKGKIPSLVRDDGSVLTEFQAIAFWLARSNPGAGLLADDLEGQIRTMEVMDHIVGSVHMRGFTFVVVPQKFTASPEFQAELTAHGREQIALGFARIAERFVDNDWLMGAYSIADAALFYLTQWATTKDIDMPPELAAFHNRMLDRPAVQRALVGEGLVGKRV